MSKFLTRIELHYATWPDDYNALHKAMINEGFTNQIKGVEEDGSTTINTYELPTAEYYIELNGSVRAIRQKAEKAANTLGKKYGIITVEVLNLTWERA